MKRILVIFYVVAILGLFSIPAEVSAHAYLAGSTPRQESGMNPSLQEIRLQFTEKINADISQVTVKDSSGNIVNTQQSSENGEWIILRFASLPKGVYTVDWQVLSVDSHVTDGSFRFAVGMELAKIRPADTVSLDEAAPVTPVPPAQQETVVQQNHQPMPVQPASNSTKPATKAKPADSTNSSNSTNSTSPIKPSASSSPTNAGKSSNQAAVDITKTQTVIPPIQSPATAADANANASLPSSGEAEAGPTPVPAPMLMPSEHVHEHAHEQHQMNHQDHQHSHSSWWLRVLQIFVAFSVGSFLFLRVWPDFMKVIQETGRPFVQLERKVFYLAIILFLLLDLTQIVLLATQLSMCTNHIWSTILTILTSSLIGVALLIRMVVMVGLIWLSYQSKTNAPHYWLRGILFIGLIIPFHLTGHQMTVDMFWGVPLLSHMIHCGAATVWAGGLLGLVYLSLSKEQPTLQLPNLAKQFSKAALTAVILMTVTGFILSSFKLQSFDELLSTSYGNVLLWKIGAFVVALMIASILRFFILPSVTSKMAVQVTDNRSLGSLVWCLRTELVAAIVILLVAGILATTAPPM